MIKLLSKNLIKNFNINYLFSYFTPVYFAIFIMFLIFIYNFISLNGIYDLFSYVECSNGSNNKEDSIPLSLVGKISVSFTEAVKAGGIGYGAAGDKIKNCSKNSLDPNWVTGYVDAEGCFSASLSQSRNPNNWLVYFSFRIGVHSSEIELLKNIQLFFGNIGRVGITSTKNEAYFVVNNKTQLIKLLNHFESYPLQSYKQINFKLFKQILNLAPLGKGFTLDSAQEIAYLINQLNTSLSPKLLQYFPNVLKREKLIITRDPIVINPYWLSGFVDGDGSFYVSLVKDSSRKLGFAVNPTFSIIQNSKDLILLKNIIGFLECGSIANDTIGINSVRVSNFINLSTKIIPFFKKYNLRTSKQLDFIKFNEILNIISKKDHLTLNGFNQIKSITLTMNNNRRKSFSSNSPLFNSGSKRSFSTFNFNQPGTNPPQSRF